MLNNLIKKLIPFFSVAIFFFFSFSNSTHGAACSVTAARWGNSAVVVGQTVRMILTVSDVQDCQGINLGVNIFEDDISIDENLVALLNNPFSGSNKDFVIQYAMTEANYVSGGNEVAGETIYFIAAATGQSQKVTSANIDFKKTVTGTTINNFNLSPSVFPTTSGGTTMFQMTLGVTLDVTQFNNI